NGIGPVMKNVKEHLAFQVRLEKEGIMFAAGPNWTDDEKSWDGDGMVVIRANSLADAKKIMERDPMHKSGARKFKIRPRFVNQGRVSTRINYSKGTFEMIGRASAVDRFVNRARNSRRQPAAPCRSRNPMPDYTKTPPLRPGRRARPICPRACAKERSRKD